MNSNAQPAAGEMPAVDVMNGCDGSHVSYLKRFVGIHLGKRVALRVRYARSYGPGWQRLGATAAQ